MSRYPWFLVLAMVSTACASKRSEQRPVSEAPPAPVASPATAPPVGEPGAPGAPGTMSRDELRKEAQEALSRTQARLDEATREQQFARSELDGARQEQQRAQQQADAANRSDDALARARAAEALEVATGRARVADAHADYAQRLVAARAADVDAARSHLAVVELQVAPAPDPSHPQRVADALRTEEDARARALGLGQAALTAERQWHALAQTTAGSSGESARSAAETGLGSGATESTGDGPGAPAPEPPPTR